MIIFLLRMDRYCSADHESDPYNEQWKYIITALRAQISLA